MKTLILGIGNLLLGDEGIGIHAVKALKDSFNDPDVVVLDAGTAVLDALPELEAADRVIIIDAVKAGREPGSVYRIPYEDCMSSSCIASMHGFDLKRVLSLSRKKRLPEVVVIGVEPKRIDWSVQLSPELSSVLPRLLSVVEDEINSYNDM